MGVAKDFRRRHLVRRLAQCVEEAVKHAGICPYCPHGAGAAFLLGQEGVDGLFPATGVAAVLEAVRAIQARGPTERPLIVLITDAEELGLDGARVFFGDYPDRARIGFVVNLEARGGGGRAMMFETGPGNAGAVGLLAAAVVETNVRTETERQGVEFARLGETLFAEWAVPFEVASLLLLVALIGAVVLVRSDGGRD